MQKFFITATGTGIGKTVVTTTLCHQLRKTGKKVAAIKPVISGYDPLDRSNDTALILDSLGLDATEENIGKVSPWRLAAPLSPDMAAENEGKKIDIGEVVAFCKGWEIKDFDILLAEGAGGVCVPLNDTSTILDLMVELGFKIILVTGSYLGTISHTLTAFNTMHARGLAIHALIINESENSPVDMVRTKDSITNFIPKETVVITMPRLSQKTDNKKLWETMPDISKVCS
jgi:dethiobiotin synthetase